MQKDEDKQERKPGQVGERRRQPQRQIGVGRRCAERAESPVLAESSLQQVRRQREGALSHNTETSDLSRVNGLDWKLTFS